MGRRDTGRTAWRLAVVFAVVAVCGLQPAGPVSAKSQACKRAKFLSGHRATVRITCAVEERAGSSVTVNAIWPHDAGLFIHFTNKSCARTHAKAKALIRREGNEGLVFDQLLPTTGDRRRATVGRTCPPAA